MHDCYVLRLLMFLSFFHSLFNQLPLFLSQFVVSFKIFFKVQIFQTFSNVFGQCASIWLDRFSKLILFHGKNKTPIIPFEERIAIVRELKCVDLAVPQTSMNKMEAWEKYHFDALFHGSDWKGSNMYNKLIEEFSAVGVDVVFFPHTENVSSTLLSEVLHRLYCEGEH